MFKFLKDKLKKAIDKFSKNVDEEVQDTETAEPKKEAKEEQKPESEKAEVKEEQKAEEESLEYAPAEEKEVKEAKEDIEVTESEEEPREEEASEPEEPEEEPEEEKADEPEEEPEEVVPEKKEEEQKPEKEQDIEEEQQVETPPPEKPVEKPEEEKPEEPEEKPEEEKPEEPKEEPVKEPEEEKPEEPKEEPVEKSEEEKPEEPKEKPVKEPEEEKPEEPKEEPVEEPEEEKPEEPKEEQVPVEKPKESLLTRIRKKVTKAKETPKQEEPKETKDTPEQVQDETKGKKASLLKKITDSVTKKSLPEDKFNELFWDLEVVLMENNVAVSVIDKIRDDLKDRLVNTRIRLGKTQEVILSSLEHSLEELFIVEKLSLIEEVRQKKPYVILFVGVNGAGKTTTIAKLVKLLEKNGLSSVLAAADTFRAAAIQQLAEHAQKLGVRMIKHDYGSDPAAVAFDAVKYAKAKKIDTVLIDTAGRQHSNVNLMEELRKVVRVAKPDLKIFVGESITGNDCVLQAQQFDKAIGIDAIILSKADVDEKGGAAISISYVTKKPILYIGTGQTYDSLQEFDSKSVTGSLGLA